jgi:hypothetical protein
MKKVMTAVATAAALVVCLAPTAAQAAGYTPGQWTTGGVPIATPLPANGVGTLTFTSSAFGITVTCDVAANGNVSNVAGFGIDSTTVTYSNCTTNAAVGCTVTAVETNNPVPSDAMITNVTLVPRDLLQVTVQFTFAGPTCVIAAAGTQTFSGRIYPKVVANALGFALIFNSGDPDQGTLTGPAGIVGSVDGGVSQTIGAGVTLTVS